MKNAAALVLGCIYTVWCGTWKAKFDGKIRIERLLDFDIT